MVLSSCARKGLPPGGPPDVTPPRVVSSYPDSGDVQVTGVSEICIDFNERMEKRSVRDVIAVRPKVQVREGRWHKNTFCLVLDDSLQPSSTYCVIVMGGCKDSHGNYMKSPHLAAFSTGDTLLAGVIQGSVLAKGLPASGIPVWAFDSLSCPEPDFTKDEAHYVSQSGAAGDFKLIGLPSGTYLLYVFKDEDANRAYDEETDFVSAAPAPAHITPEEPEVLGVEIALLDPNEPGRITGVVEHCLPETVRVVVTATSTEDSLALFSAPVMRDSTFAIGNLPPGRYLVSCYADANLNETFDAPEESGCVDVHSVHVLPGETVKDVTLVISCEKEPAFEEEESRVDESPESDEESKRNDEAPQGQIDGGSPPEKTEQQEN